MLLQFSPCVRWRREGVSGASFPPGGLDDAEWREMVPRMAIRLPLKRLMDQAMKHRVTEAAGAAAALLEKPKAEPAAKTERPQRVGRGGVRRKAEKPPVVEDPDEPSNESEASVDEAASVAARVSPRAGPGRGGRRKPGPKPRKKEPRVSLEGVKEEDMLDVSK